MKRYLVKFEKNDTSYSSYILYLPGCIATGKTREECESNIWEAFKFHLKGMREEGSPFKEGLLRF